MKQTPQPPINNKSGFFKTGESVETTKVFEVTSENEDDRKDKHQTTNKDK